MDKRYYGEFGGQYVAESLMNTLQELDAAYEEAIRDPEFLKECAYYLREYVGRETPLYFAERLCHRADSFGKTDGKDEGHCRDRCRTAWSGNGDGSGAF